MAFSVYLSSDEAFDHSYGDKDVYKLLASGYLEVTPAQGAEVFTYSGWVYLKADADHRAGGVKGASGAAPPRRRVKKRATKRATKT